MICDGPGGCRRRMCGRMGMMFMRMGQAPINGTKILRGRSTSIALSRSSLIIARAGAHQVAVMVVEQPPNSQQISDADEVRPQLLHHRLGLGAGVEVELAAKDCRKNVELLVGNVVGS